MPIIDNYDAIAKRMRELELPVQAQSHKDTELLEKWRAAALDTARTYVQKRRRELALGAPIFWICLVYLFFVAEFSR